MVPEDAHFQKKNLSCSCVDLREHNGIHFNLINLVKSVTKTWRIKLEVDMSDGRDNQYNQSEQEEFCKAIPFVEDCLLLH